MSKFSLKSAIAALTIAILTYLTILYILHARNEGESYLPTVIFACLLGALLFYVWVDNNQTALIRDLNNIVKAYAEGDLTPKIIINQDDELGALNESLRQMADVLNNRLMTTEKEKDQMGTILASMAEGVLAFDISGRLLMMNKTAEDMVGIDFREAENRFFLEVFRHYQLADLLKKCLSDGTRQMLEIRLSNVDGEYYRVYITPIMDKEENSQGAIVVLRNITEVRLLEQVRSDFVANVSHELRTPLTSIKGYVETLLDGAIEDRPTAMKFLGIIENEADRLSRLISDLLYLSKIETGRMELAKKWLDSQKLTERVVELLDTMAQQKKINIERIVHEGAESIYGNFDMLEQVLLNLLENAIKYSPDGGVVKIEIDCCDEGRLIKVIDKGIGIPPESLSRIFERFYRVDKGRSRKVGGTGLGLAIVKHVVDRHRGQVLVESVEDAGTTFTIILPIN